MRNTELEEAMDVSPSPSAEIRALSEPFVGSFQTSTAMSAFIRSLEEVSEIGPDRPSDNVSGRKMAGELAEYMARRGLASKEFCHRLAEVRPGHVDLIEYTAKSSGLHSVLFIPS